MTIIPGFGNLSKNDLTATSFAKSCSTLSVSADPQTSTLAVSTLSLFFETQKETTGLFTLKQCNLGLAFGNTWSARPGYGFCFPSRPGILQSASPYSGSFLQTWAPGGLASSTTWAPSAPAAWSFSDYLRCRFCSPSPSREPVTARKCGRADAGRAQVSAGDFARLSAGGEETGRYSLGGECGAGGYAARIPLVPPLKGRGRVFHRIHQYSRNTLLKRPLLIQQPATMKVRSSAWTGGLHRLNDGYHRYRST